MSDRDSEKPGLSAERATRVGDRTDVGSPLLRAEVGGAFGKVLRNLRRQRGLSQEKLAELASCDKCTISSLERARRTATVTMIFNIARGLGMQPSQLVSEAETRLVRNLHGTGVVPLLLKGLEGQGVPDTLRD
jgi:ribosome-binding protein aMBF1 (putative translation factor)